VQISTIVTTFYELKLSKAYYCTGEDAKGAEGSNWNKDYKDMVALVTNGKRLVTLCE